MMVPPPTHSSFSSAKVWYKLTEIKDWFYNLHALMLDTLAPGFLAYQRKMMEENKARLLHVSPVTSDI